METLFNLADGLSIGEVPYPLKRITKQQFDEDRNRRFGTTNPQKFDIPYWNAVVEYGIDPWKAREYFVYGKDPDAPDETLNKKPENEDVADLVDLVEEASEEQDEENASPPQKIDFTHAKYGDNVISEGQFFGDLSANFMSNPIFCNCRIGRTTTELPDGTRVRIGGEWEDFYDPDFMVYNDVIVYAPATDDTPGFAGCAFKIYGYPEDVFPPTDFHTATYVPSMNAILILGNMSTTKEDDDLAARGVTPVYILKIGTWEIEKVETLGDGPGVIFKHEAELKDDVLRITGVDEEYEFDRTKRRVIVDGKARDVAVEFGEAWQLSLADMTWTRDSNEWQTVSKKTHR